MLKPLEILMSEHRVIEQVLDCLEKLTEGCRSAGKLNKDSARQTLAFFRTFADRCHHAKEEAHPTWSASEAVAAHRVAGSTTAIMSGLPFRYAGAAFR